MTDSPLTRRVLREKLDYGLCSEKCCRGRLGDALSRRSAAPTGLSRFASQAKPAAAIARAAKDFRGLVWMAAPILLAIFN